MNFRLPEDPKKRNQVYAVIGIFGALLLYGIYAGAITPTMKSRKATLAKIQELTEEIQTANNEIAQIAGDRKKYSETLLAIKDLSDKYVLPPGLDGTYQLGASSVIEKHAKTVGITVEGVQETGIADLLPPTNVRNAPSRALKAYSVRVSLTASYKDVIRLVRTLEADNPLACVIGVTITGRPLLDPKNHTVYVDVQWPIWTDPGMPAKVAKQIKEGPAKPASDAKSKSNQDM